MIQKKTLFNNVVLLQEKYGYLKEGDQTFDKINRVQVAHLNKTKDDYQYIYDSNGNILNKITYNLKTKEFIKENEYRYASNRISDMLVNFYDESCIYDRQSDNLNV